MKQLQVLLLAVTLSSSMYAQKRVCESMSYLQQSLNQDAGLKGRMEAIEEHTNQFVKANPKGQRLVITIPVVVHVVYNTGAQNVSASQIQSQIDVLNADFRKLNADASLIPAAWQTTAADCEINFCMAQRDPAGNATTGVERRQTTVTAFSTNDAMKKYAQGGLDAWDASKYLNLWVCNMSGGILGYAQFPGGTAATDGVVILYSAFGTTGTATAPFNKGRTATHEVGHWLNLRHIWGDDTNCTGSDLVADTPNQQAENYGCPAFPRTDACTTTSPGVMTMNYMDYTDDACMYMFTAGQKARMQALFATGGTRLSLVSSNGCVPPAPVTCATPTGVSVGSVSNTSAVVSWAAVAGAASYNVIVGANTYTSTSTSYTLSNLAACTSYNVSVQAVCGNTNGSSTASAAVPFTTTGCVSPCSDVYENNNTTNKAKAIAVNTDITALISSSTDLDWFKFSNTSANPNIKVSLTNLPANYTLTLYSPTGATLGTSANTGTTNESIIYNNGAAGTYKVRVSGASGAFNSTLCYKLRADISSTTWVRLADEVEGEMSLSSFTIYPNPTTGMAILRFNTLSEVAEKVSISIFDQTGRIMRNIEHEVTESSNELSLDFSNYANGLYFIQMTKGETITNSKIIVAK